MISNEQAQGGSQSLMPSSGSAANRYQATDEYSWLQSRYSPGRILAITLGGIVLAEIIAMIVVYYFRGWPYTQQIILDASIMTVIIFPLLYFLSFKPILSHVQQRIRSESILQARLRLIEYANTHTLDELLQYALDNIEAMTGSMIGFFHYLEDDQKTIRLQAWSTNTLQNMCMAEGKGSHYDIADAGVWADAVRRGQAIIHNSYSALMHRKGLPDGHAQVIRELVVPILRDAKVMATLGVGNKPQDYTDNDVDLASTYADFAWDIIVRKQAEIAIYQSEEKFRTFVDWTHDWEEWLDPNGNIVYASPSRERMTGFNSDEFTTDPRLLLRIIHPDDRQLYEEHRLIIHEDTAGPATIEFRLIARNGRERWIEHICRPVYGPHGRYLGRRVSNRDITQRKLAAKKIFEQTQREKILTQTIHSIQSDVARDLHDTLGQNIGYLNMSLAYLLESEWADMAVIKNQVWNMTKVANESYELIRAMLAILRSGNTADPLTLFKNHAEQVASRSSFLIDFSNQGTSNTLSPDQIRQLYYMFREALSNIEKYSHATHVSVEFSWQEHTLTLVVSDNGRGFDPEAVQTTDHYGLKFMRERAELMGGSCSIQSAPDQGTTVELVIPYEGIPVS